MKIRKANPDDLETVFRITQQTIRAVYPHYYPSGAVDFFAQHHRKEAIRADIADGIVYLLEDESGNAAGTVTLRKNEICRLFVLPDAQGNGYGRALLDFAEAKIAKQSDEIVLDASFSAKAIYIKRGYKEIAYHVIDTENGDHLCYDVMTKKYNRRKME